MRGLAAVLLIVIAMVPTLVGAEEDVPRIPEREADYGELFPFGVRGLPATYRNVPGGDARLEAMEKGCAWLVAHQAPNGSFPCSDLSWCNGAESTRAPEGRGKHWYDTGVTGMAISAILGSGYTPRGKHPFAAALRKGLQYLLKIQDKEGCFGERRPEMFLYNHAFCLMAVIDAYGVTGDAQLKQAVLKGLAFTERARNPGFAWRYGIKPGDNDTSLTGCMSLPLVAAHKINGTAERVGYVPPFDVPRDAFKGARAWIEKVTEPDYGKVGYLSRGTGAARTREMLDKFPAEKSCSMTAIGMVVRLIVPGDDPKRDKRILGASMKLLTETIPTWTDEGTNDFYYWYYGALATAAMGGDAADAWQQAFAREVVQNQRTDGEVCMYAGSWDPVDPWGPDGGRTYSTAILMLGLQAPDRMRQFTRGRRDLTAALLEKKLDVELRARIVAAVGHHKVSGGDKVLTQSLEHEAPAVRVAAARALGKTAPTPKTVRVLVSALGDKEATVRRAAAESLGHVEPLPASAVEPLLAALKGADATLSAAAASALRTVAAEPNVKAALQSALQAPAAGVRVAAAGALWGHHTPDALVLVWVAGLQDADATARAQSAAWLARAGKQATGAVGPLQAVLKDKVPLVRVRAALALQEIAGFDSKLVSTFTTVLGGDPRVQMLALKALTRLGPRASSATLSLAHVARRGVLPLQRLALGALAAIGPGADQAAPALWFLAERGDSRLQKGAREAIAGLKLDPKRATAIYISKLDDKDLELVEGAVAGLRDVGAPAVPAVSLQLSDKSTKKQIGALRALAGMGEPAAAALDRLRDLLAHSKSTGVREWAARTLGAIGPKARPAMPSLVAQLEDRSKQVAATVARAIGDVGADSDGAVDALGKLLRTKGQKGAFLRVAALEALGKSGPSGAPVVSTMITIAADDKRPESVREAAKRAMVSLGPVALPRMQAALKGGSQKLAWAACQVLEKMGSDAKPAVPELILYLSAPKSSWADGAGNALAAIGKPALKPLLKLLKHDRASVRRAAVRAVGLLGPIAKSYAGSVKRLRKDGNPNVRKAAETAYKQIKKK